MFYDVIQMITERELSLYSTNSSVFSPTTNQVNQIYTQNNDHFAFHK